VFTVKRFHQYLYGRKFILYSDLQPLKYFLAECVLFHRWHPQEFNAGLSHYQPILYNIIRETRCQILMLSVDCMPLTEIAALVPTPAE
jgi:hypothetical protein